MLLFSLQRVYPRIRCLFTISAVSIRRQKSREVGNGECRLASRAEWLACWPQAQKGLGSIAVATLSGNGLRQTVHTNRASVHQAAKLVAALLRAPAAAAANRRRVYAYADDKVWPRCQASGQIR